MQINMVISFASGKSERPLGCTSIVAMPTKLFYCSCLFIMEFFSAWELSRGVWYPMDSPDADGTLLLQSYGELFIMSCKVQVKPSFVLIVSHAAICYMESLTLPFDALQYGRSMKNVHPSQTGIQLNQVHIIIISLKSDRSRSKSIQFNKIVQMDLFNWKASVHIFVVCLFL